MSHPSLHRNNVRVVGATDAASTLVFVHGFGSDQGAWTEVAAAFAPAHRLVLLDNVGAATTRAEHFAQHRYLNLETYASDLLEVCEALGLRGATFVGHSVGAMIALLAAVRRPECCARLVLIGASPRYREDGDYHGGMTDADVAAIYAAMSANYAEWADRYAPIAVGAAAGPAVASAFASALRSIPAERALTVLCSILQTDYRTRLREVRQPTLVIHARDDLIVPVAVAEYLQREIRDSRPCWLDTGGHLPHVTAAPGVVAGIRGFLASTPQP